MYESNTELKEFLTSVIRNSPYGVLTVDLKGNITLVNSPVLDSLDLKFKTEDIIDSHILELIGHIPRFEEEINYCYSVSRRSFDLDKISVNDKYLRIKCRKILSGLLITIENITDEIIIYNSLVKSKKELEELAEVSTHDIKSHVTSLTGLIDLLDHEEAVKGEFQSEFNRVKEAVSLVSNKVKTLNDIIEFNKTLKVKPKRVDLQKQLKKVLNEMAGLMAAAEASVDADFSGCPYINFTPEHIRTILHQLIANSIKFRKEDLKPVIKIRSYCKGDFNIIEFKDNGIGFSAAQHKDKIFKIFHKFNTAASGMGIGLYIVNKLVAAYEGKIEVSSRPGKGTCFKILLKNE
ncbi:MAG: sensor histidine kinase [Candidatus Cyclobacteriaceae bacterium M2_1C_046]